MINFKIKKLRAKDLNTDNHKSCKPPGVGPIPRRTEESGPPVPPSRPPAGPGGAGCVAVIFPNQMPQAKKKLDLVETDSRCWLVRGSQRGLKGSQKNREMGKSAKNADLRSVRHH